MARTKRRYIKTAGPDGKMDFFTVIRRDNRATGLRDHRRDRREARIILRTSAEDTLTAGKKRRYSMRYGDYRY